MTEIHRAGQIIGYRRDGRAIRLQAGGSMPATETPPAPAGDPAAPPAPAQPAAPAASVQPPAPDPAPAGQVRNPDGTFAPAPAQQQPVPQPPVQQVPAQQAPADPTDWKAVAEQARAEAAAEVERVKTEAQADIDRWKKYARQHEDRLKVKNETVRGQDAILREIALKVGVDYDDSPDPAQLATALAEQTQRTRDLSVERAIYLGAAREGADAVALLDSREFLAKAAALDPESAAFPDLVRDLVRDAAKEDRYKLPPPKTLTTETQQPAQLQPAAQFQPPPAQPPVQQQPPAAASGADFSGAPPGDGLWDQATYDYWATGPGRAIDRDGKIMTDAIAAGKLVRLGVGPGRRPSRR
jgi:hypothetical protein